MNYEIYIEPILEYFQPHFDRSLKVDEDMIRQYLLSRYDPTIDFKKTKPSANDEVVNFLKQENKKNRYQKINGKIYDTTTEDIPLIIKPELPNWYLLKYQDKENIIKLTMKKIDSEMINVDLSGHEEFLAKLEIEQELLKKENPSNDWGADDKMEQIRQSYDK